MYYYAKDYTYSEEKEPVQTQQKTVFLCPSCKREVSLSHLLNRENLLPEDMYWTCDECGNSFKMTRGEGTLLAQKAIPPSPEPEYKKLVLLEIPPREHSLFFVVEATQYRTEEECGSGDEYFYNEHTCPTNWIRHVRDIIDTSDLSTDPHGVAQYRGSIRLTEDIDDKIDNLSGREYLWLFGLFYDIQTVTFPIEPQRITASFLVKEGEDLSQIVLEEDNEEKKQRNRERIEKIQKTICDELERALGQYIGLPRTEEVRESMLQTTTEILDYHFPSH